jgi:hypothetical protein
MVANGIGNPSRLAAYILIGVTGLLLACVIALNKLDQVEKDLHLKQPHVVTGKIMLRAVDRRTSGDGYKLIIGQIELLIPRCVYKALEDGKKYRVYYTPKTRTLLGVERIH